MVGRGLGVRPLRGSARQRRACGCVCAATARRCACLLGASSVMRPAGSGGSASEPAAEARTATCSTVLRTQQNAITRTLRKPSSGSLLHALPEPTDTATIRTTRRHRGGTHAGVSTGIERQEHCAALRARANSPHRAAHAAAAAACQRSHTHVPGQAGLASARAPTATAEKAGQRGGGTASATSQRNRDGARQAAGGSPAMRRSFEPRCVSLRALIRHRLPTLCRVGSPAASRPFLPPTVPRRTSPPAPLVALCASPPRHNDEQSNE